MENLDPSLHFLIYTTGILFIIIGVFIAKLLMDLSNLTKSVDSLTKKVDQEVAPTLKEVQATLVNINSIISTVEKQMGNAKHQIEKGFSGISKASHKAYGCALNVFDIVKHGFFEGVKAFNKKD